MGLLDGLDNDMTRFGLGLLAASGPTNDPMKGAFGSRLMQAVGSYDDYRKEKEATAFRKVQMDNYLSEIEQRKLAAAKQAKMMAMVEGMLGGNTSGAGLTQAPQDVGMGGAQGMSFAGVSAGKGGGASPIPANDNPGGLANMTPDQLAKLKVFGGVDLTDVYKLTRPNLANINGTMMDSTDPRNAGRYIGDPTKGIDYDPSSKRVSLLPGYADTQTELTAATEEGKARYNLVDVPMGDGTTRKMPVSEFVKQTVPAQPKQPTAPTTRASGYAGGSAGSAATGQREILEQELRNPNLSPEDRKAIDRELSRLPKMGQTQSPIEAGRVKNITEAGGKVNDTWLKTSYEPVIQSGSSAQSIIDSTVVARNALKAIGGGGWGTEARAGAASVLAGLGIAPKNAEMFAANSQVFQSKAMERLWATLNEAKGPQTEGDADRASKTYASLKNTPQANDFILDMTQANAERQKAKAAFFKNALPIAQGKGDLMEVEREWDKRSPSIFDMPSMQRWKK